ncbi:DNA translocase FtsK [Texcoconibacillus texcoconensis]|uniref:S-DNA-T family DNA segregation ATPase FtsK/SpoIIIE n=1 Tax=Texcoconibacillus texcoconensis TaxID=1095777 RepID=A0A840QKH1_9BACI|nr:DNA translocase FtsK [Texcoconibacillus texcoconensis]MBB5172016.1 S-DNA-T family DNA segregation ATPase FtsK/SpoIIIE [Texcoconibacillus texcoconensis]
MGKKKKRKQKRKTTLKRYLMFELIGLALLVVSTVTFARLGAVGESIVQLFRFFVGDWHVVLTAVVFFLSFYLMVKREIPPLWSRRLAGVYLLFLSVILWGHINLFDDLSRSGTFIDPSIIRNTWELYILQLQGEVASESLGGGMVGAIGYSFTHFLFDSGGTMAFSIALMITSGILITNRSFIDLFRKAGEKLKPAFKNRTIQSLATLKAIPAKLVDRLKTRQPSTEIHTNQSDNQSYEPDIEESPEVVIDDIEEPVIYDFSKKAYQETENQQLQEQENQSQDSDQPASNSENESPTLSEGESLIVPEAENVAYELPTLDLLTHPTQTNQQQEHQVVSRNARKLEKTLESFGVHARVSKVHLGPAVTKYEVYPNTGVKVSKIVNLSDDLALALAAKDIRMEAPIPGKSAIGIEVPNQEVAMVTLREVLEASDLTQSDNRLCIGLGRDISGEAVVAELNKMPHLLVAGATGSGKSVCINGIICSILMRSKPHEVKLMMIDPKMVELNVYNGVPHLLSPVVTDPKKAAQALKRVVSEMERRYELFADSGTRNIEGYNVYVQKENDKRADDDEKKQELPYIVVIVDELADLMMVASSEVEDAITRLAQMARAAGIHLIIATQRPSVDVITGVIKANIPSRIAFGVSSQTDSRTILDGNGAEKLLGKGDMLYLPVGASKPTRIQGAFLSDEEVERVVDAVVAQQKAQYAEEMIPSDEEPSNKDDVDDDLYDDAVQLVISMQTASVSMLQRRFRVGYARAARLIDEMEARGIVGPYGGSKPRDVLVSQQEQEEETS